MVRVAPGVVRVAPGVARPFMGVVRPLGVVGRLPRLADDVVPTLLDERCGVTFRLDSEPANQQNITRQQAVHFH